VALFKERKIEQFKDEERLNYERHQDDLEELRKQWVAKKMYCENQAKKVAHATKMAHFYSVHGLRTLVLARRVLSGRQTKRFVKGYTSLVELKAKGESKGGAGGGGGGNNASRNQQRKTTRNVEVKTSSSGNSNQNGSGSGHAGAKGNTNGKTGATGINVSSYVNSSSGGNQKGGTSHNGENAINRKDNHNGGNENFRAGLQNNSQGQTQSQSRSQNSRNASQGKQRAHSSGRGNNKYRNRNDLHASETDLLVEDLSHEFERDLEILGIVGIEDRIQEGVKESIDCLLAAGTRVWVLSGDKQETSVNVL
jgi:hypothetical protein